MSYLLTRSLFASASVALTLAMVAASAPASAAVNQTDVHRAIVKIDDLDLGKMAGRQMLRDRLNAAVDAVCPENEAVDRIAEQRCRTAAFDQARAAVTHATEGAAA